MQMPTDQTAYYQTVWEIVRQVPPGQVVTFGQIAVMIPPAKMILSQKSTDGLGRAGWAMR